MRISATVEVDTLKKTLERNKIGVLRFKPVSQLRTDLSQLHLPFQRVSTCNGMCLGLKLARSVAIAMVLLPEPHFELLPCTPFKGNPREGLKGSGRCLKHLQNVLAEASTRNQSIHSF